MKDVLFIINGLGINNFYQANIYIYDNNELIKCLKTYNGRVNVCLKSNKAYRVIVNSYAFSIYILDNVNTYYLSYFTNANRVITFLLKDINYDMPIERGSLWLRR